MSYFLDCTDIQGNSQHNIHKNKVHIYNFIPPSVKNIIHEKASYNSSNTESSKQNVANFRCLLDSSALIMLTMLWESSTTKSITIFKEGTANSANSGVLTTSTLSTYKFQDCVFKKIFIGYDEQGMVIDSLGEKSSSCIDVSFVYNNMTISKIENKGNFETGGKTTYTSSILRGATKK